MMPAITANWTAPAGQQWSVPIGANFGKVVIFGKQSVKFIAGGGYFVTKPDNGPDWQIFVQAVFFVSEEEKIEAGCGARDAGRGASFYILHIPCKM